MPLPTPPNFSFHDLQPALGDFQREVIEGLSLSPPQIPPKFFYDEEGSRLFDEITRLDAYYPTRTEIALLRRHGAEIAQLLGQGTALIELGSGSDVKIRTLLNVLKPAEYLPLDISESHLRESASGIAADYPGMRVSAVCVDYTESFELPPIAARTRVAFYPGSSIGNFEPAEVVILLRRVAQMVGPGGRLLVGVDLEKDAARLEAAYNDEDGATARFNRNLLVRMRNELGADVEVDAFAHHAFYNAQAGRVEMHLVALRPTHIALAGQAFGFAEGHGIHTENSYKYSVEAFHTLAARAGFSAEKAWCDDENLFSVHCLRAAP